MSSVVITLGGVTFQDFEVPERIKIGGAQRLVVHQLIGGGRVVNVLGDEPGKIVFSGMFTGSDAAARAQILDAATALGAQIPLVWDSFFYTVIIQEFQADYEKPWWIPFSISCAVAIDPAAQIAAAVGSVTSLIGDDIDAAMALAPQSRLSLSLGGSASAAALAAGQLLISNGLAASGAALAGGVVALNGAIDAPGACGALADIVATSGEIAAISGMAGYVNRAANNLANELV
jgi:uncharacterized protein YciI